ncbi:MAG: SMP-30/gluconolactonase/LRE family protein [Gammaproteobacteria bacterium]|jgi:sugar lactone lactonase YvrE
MTKNPIDNFTVTAADFLNIGEDLQRPECILAERDGTLWSADARGGVVRIAADGTQTVITQSHSGLFEVIDDPAGKFTGGTLPNGLAFADNGDIWISNFGTDCLERMQRSGATQVVLDSLDGEPIGKVNFIARDSRNRIWITISTMIRDWSTALCKSVIDGRVLLYEPGKGARIVADGLHFTNECKLDAGEEYLYVVQTCGRNVVRFRIGANGDLSDRETFGPSDHGRFIDGIAFDDYGNLWGTYIMNDGIFALTPDGERKMIFDDSSAAEVRKVDKAFQTGAPLGMDFLLECGGKVAPWCASVTFGGADLKTVYVGSLRGTTIPYFTAPVAGLPMVHWATTF